MALKKPENEEDGLMIEEIKRKIREKESRTLEEAVFVIKHNEYFIDSEELAIINKEVEEFGKILEKACVRVKNPRVWTR